MVEYDNVKDLYVLLMQFAFLKDWNTAAHRLCCERELLGVAEAASVGIKFAPLVSNFTELSDYAMCKRIGEGNCIYMLKCIYGHVQALRQYYMLCRKVYQKAGLKQLHTDADRSVVTDAKDLWLQIQKSKEANCEVMQEFERAVKQDGQLSCDLKASLTGFFRCAILTTRLPARSA